MLIYLDTNIYLDWLEGRTDRLRPLGEFAFSIIKRAISCEFEIVVSDFVISELSKFVNEKEIMGSLDILKRHDKLMFIKENPGDFKEAKELSAKYGIHWQDALHAVLAKEAGAEVIVTRDNHLSCLSDFIKAVFPDNI